MKNVSIVTALTQFFSTRTADQYVGKRALNRQFLRGYPRLTGERRRDFYTLLCREREALRKILDSSPSDRDLHALDVLRTLADEVLTTTKEPWDARLERDPDIEELDEDQRNVHRVMAELCAWNDAAE